MLKLTVIGGGGVRSIFLAKSIAQYADNVGIGHLVFMDNDPEKLRVFGGMARQASHILKPELTFELTTDPIAAVRDADYVITTIRAGGDAARCRDEHAALDAGVLGQETTGAAGFSFAMRSVPALIGYCGLIRRYAKPDVKVFNFTNPVGIVSQALRDAGYDFTFGICDAPSGMLHQFADLYHEDPSDVKGELFGLNHLSWFSNITCHGRNIVPELLLSEEAHSKTDLRIFGHDLLDFIGLVPNEYLYYFYYRQKAVNNILNAGRTRGDDILEINTGMLNELRGLDPEKNFRKCLDIYTKWYGMRENRYMASETGHKRDKVWSFDLCSPDDGGYAGVALNYIKIRQSGAPGEMILCVPNKGSLNFLEDNDTVEVTCDITDGAAVPHRFGDIPDAPKELIRRVKYYERIGARAILKKSRKLAIEALAAHPLVNAYDIAVSLADLYITNNEPYTGKWGE